MISQPTQSEIRETSRSFNEVYESLNAFEKTNFHQILNSIKINLIKNDWTRWLKNKNIKNLNNAKYYLRLFVKAILLFSFSIWPIMFFTALGVHSANYIVVLLIYLVLFSEVVVTQNSIAMLENEIDKNEAEIVTIEAIIKKTSMHVDIQDLLDDFLKCCESDGNFKAQEVYMPSISLSIASMIKHTTYQIERDVFF